MTNSLSENAGVAELEQLQKDCDIPHLPTQLTYQLRKAVCGHKKDEFFSWGYQWIDKPHRLVYAACLEVEALSARIAELEALGDGLQQELVNVAQNAMELEARLAEAERRGFDAGALAMRERAGNCADQHAEKLVSAGFNIAKDIHNINPTTLEGRP